MNDNRLSPEEKVFLSVIILSIILMILAMKFLTVIFNRYFSPKFPNSFEEIIVPGQFSVADNMGCKDKPAKSYH